ncbi:MAG: class I tRNA ligase family protein, partial [Candidatus Margulisiibacteriota bacterium]
PDQTEDLKNYYPTDVLVTGYDIITFWVSRMIMAGLHFMKEVPFRVVYVHGLVRDITGKKMSKSLGNVIDPVEVINHVGADALRFALISLISGQGQDIKLSEEKITEARNFANKIWNASRFVLMNAEDEIELGLPEGLGFSEKWIVSRLQRTIGEVTASIDNYEFGQAARLLYDFIWSEFCDWFIEISKVDLYAQDPSKKKKALRILFYVLENILRLLHPFMPFITEEIWQRLKTKVKGVEEKISISLCAWPKANEKLIDLAIVSDFEYLKTLIVAIRNVKANYGVQTKEIELYLKPGNREERRVVEDGGYFIKLLAKVARITVVDDPKEFPKQSAAINVFYTQGVVPLRGLIDVAQEIERLKKEEERVSCELQRISKLLADQNFITKAPAEAVAEQKNKQKELMLRKEAILEQIKNLS